MINIFLVIKKVITYFFLFYYFWRYIILLSVISYIVCNCIFVKKNLIVIWNDKNTSKKNKKPDIQ